MVFEAYTTPGQEWRLEALRALYLAGGPKTSFDHAVIGWLLGYSNEDIEAFLDLHERCGTSDHARVSPSGNA